MSAAAILAVASTPSTVAALLQRLVKDVVDERAASVPWTIANKYYTADVEFVLHSPSSVQHELAPALLFVWNRGEPYRDQIRTLSQHVSQHGFEVALAIRLSSSSPTSSPEFEDDQDVDAFLSSNGFEFIDVPDVEPSLPDRTGILGIPRIVDALSTIMWPSMVRRGSGQIGSGISPDDYHTLARLVGEKISGGRMQRELDELERWLDEDDMDVHSTVSEDDAVPWSTAVTPGTLSPSSSGFLETSRPTTPKAGFDDDFTSFVSAPPARFPEITAESQHFPRFASSFSSTFSFDSPSSGCSTPMLDDRAGLDTTRLAPSGTYKSLGSMSDLGDPESGIDVEDMPSRLEIADASRRIFGGIPLALSPTQERGEGRFQTFGSQDFSGEDDVEMTDESLEQVDLQGVLGALQGLKEEIAGMPDKERRKAAARVALGLAYGLHPQPEELV